MDFALNNLQWLICQKTKPNMFATTYIYIYNYMSTDMLVPTCICIIASKFVHLEKKEFTVSDDI